MFHEQADLLPQPLVDRHQVGRLPRLVVGPAEVVGAMQLADQPGRRPPPERRVYKSKNRCTRLSPADSAPLRDAACRRPPPPQAGAARDKNSRPASAGRPGPASTRPTGNRRHAACKSNTFASTVSIWQEPEGGVKSPSSWTCCRASLPSRCPVPRLHRPTEGGYVWSSHGNPPRSAGRDRRRTLRGRARAAAPGRKRRRRRSGSLLSPSHFSWQSLIRAPRPGGYGKKTPCLVFRDS